MQVVNEILAIQSYCHAYTWQGWQYDCRYRSSFQRRLESGKCL